MDSRAGSPDLEPSVVVFKTKDKRENRSRDKVDLIRAVLRGRRASDLLFVEGSDRSLGQSWTAGSGQHFALDVNSYTTPIVCIHLSRDERRELENHPDVDLIEDDVDFVYAGDGLARRLQVQGVPQPEVETVPAGVAAVGAPAAWGNSQGKGIRVAVLDTGIDASHPDLAANIVGGAGFVPGTPGDRDDEGHGTFCAGIIGAELNGAGVVGVAPQVSLYAVKVSDQTGSPSLRTIIAGLDWCIENNINIVSMSFGYPEPSVALYLMCKRAWESGTLLVASVGNGGLRDGVTYPAGFDTVIGVGAIDGRNAHYAQSNRGLGVNLCAPGVEVLSTGLRGGYQVMSGTSAACPHVAGAAALAWGSHRFATNAEIWNLLASTARPLGAADRFGLGRVNALAASSLMVPPPPSLLTGRTVRAGMDRTGRRTAMLSDVKDEPTHPV